jgi:hypothetical protein
MTFWEKLAEIANVVLRNKIKEPLTGADMVQLVALIRSVKNSPD